LTSDGEVVVEEPGEGSAEPTNDGGADPCGCAPRTVATSEPRAVDETAAESGEAPHAPDAPVQAPPRDVKLVVFLRPTGAGFQACLAAGAEGCDPELRVAEVPDLPAALAALAELAVAAETRWRVQRRYPPAPRPPSPARQRPAPATPARSSPNDRSSDPTSGSSTAPAAPTSAGAGQLSLFG
jgi:hypothetical protein